MNALEYSNIIFIPQNKNKYLQQVLQRNVDKAILVISEKRYKHWIPEEYHPKVKVWDVGVDRFFRGYDEELLQTFKDYFKKDPIEMIK